MVGRLWWVGRDLVDGVSAVDGSRGRERACFAGAAEHEFGSGGAKRQDISSFLPLIGANLCNGLVACHQVRVETIRAAATYMEELER